MGYQLVFVPALVELVSETLAAEPDYLLTVAEVYPFAYLDSYYYLPCLSLLLNTIVIAYIFIAIHNVST
jgi:hypothetical protein